jgi:hypothetical protein
MQPRCVVTHARARARAFKFSNRRRTPSRKDGSFEGDGCSCRKNRHSLTAPFLPRPSPLRALSTRDEHVMYENPVSRSSENHESSGSQRDVNFSHKHRAPPMRHYCRAHMRTGLYDLFHGKQLPHLDPLHQPLDTLRSPRGRRRRQNERVSERERKRMTAGGGTLRDPCGALTQRGTDCALTRTGQLSILLIRNRTRIDSR